jgi:hypothetical protein
MKMRPVGGEFHADRRTDMTKLIVAFFFVFLRTRRKTDRILTAVSTIVQDLQLVRLFSLGSEGEFGRRSNVFVARH